MTPREQQYLDDCHKLITAINLIPLEPGAKAVCINALSKHIQEVQGMWSGPALSSPDKMCFLVGLTFADLMQLQNLGSIEVNPKDVGLIDMPITIFLGGTDEHMKKGMDKHPGTAHKFLDTHGDTKN